MNETKPGYKTSEFMLALLNTLAGAGGAIGSLYVLVEKLQSAAPNNVWLGVAVVGVAMLFGGSSAAKKYMDGRTTLKATALKE
jgi:hypothetical protein